MQIKPAKLQAHLQDKLLNFYLVCGDEPLQLREACDAIRARCRAAGCQEREVLDVERGFDWQRLGTAISNMGLFSERRLVELRFGTAVPDKQAAGQIATCSEKNIGENVLLIICGKPDRRSAWFKAADAAGGVVTARPLDAQQLAEWLQIRLRQASLQLSAAAMQILKERVEGNLLAADQEIERLRLFAKDGLVDEELVLQAVADSARYDAFQLTERALAGDAPSCVKMLEGLQGEGTAPAMILGALVREIRIMAMAAAAAERGDNADAVMKRAGAWPKRLAQLKKSLVRHSSASLEQLLRQAARTDRAIKGAPGLSAPEELSRLVLGLAGKRLRA